MHPETREMFANLGSEILALAEALEQDVPLRVFDRIITLAVKVSDTSGDRMREELDEATARTLAHFPGIAPAWWVVAGHVLRGEAQPPCLERGRLHPDCQLPPLEEPG